MDLLITTLGVYLGTYEATKIVLGNIHNRYTQNDNSSNAKEFLSIRMLSAAISGCFSWLVLYPFDVIKSRIQLDYNKVKYRNALECLVISYRTGGIRSLYRGITYTLLRAGPVAATILPIYEISREKFNKSLN